MVILRLNFQVTGHKQPIIAVGYHENHVVTAELGTIKLWSISPEQVEGNGPTLLRAIACPRQPFRALFITPGGSHIVAVFAERGVVLFSVNAGSTGQYVLLHAGQNR